MSTDIHAVEWYRSCIHERQRKANSLSIEVELNAREKEDPGALAEAINCLDTAISVLEQAKDGLSESELQPAVRLRRPHRRVIPIGDFREPISEPGPLMEDLGHSMTSLDVPIVRTYGERRNGAEIRRQALDLSRVPFENSLNFFQ